MIRSLKAIGFVTLLFVALIVSQSIGQTTAPSTQSSTQPAKTTAPFTQPSTQPAKVAAPYAAPATQPATVIVHIDSPPIWERLLEMIAASALSLVGAWVGATLIGRSGKIIVQDYHWNIKTGTLNGNIVTLFIINARNTPTSLSRFRAELIRDKKTILTTVEPLPITLYEDEKAASVEARANMPANGLYQYPNAPPDVPASPIVNLPAWQSVRFTLHGLGYNNENISLLPDDSLRIIAKEPNGKRFTYTVYPT